MDHEYELFCAEELLGSPLIRENSEINEMRDFSGNHQDDNYGINTDFPEQDGNSIMSLVEKEVYHMPDAGYVAVLQAEDACAARLQAVDWMFKVHKRHKFNPLTITLSVNYMDRYIAKYFLAKRSWKAWMFQLLSVACLSLAAKVEEVHVPALQDFQIECVEQIFDAKTIQRMELAVLSSLGWRMNSVTAFAYIDFLLHRVNFGKHQQNFLITRITELLLATLLETAFVDYRPSIIALCATICALEESRPLQAEKHKRTLFQLFSFEQDKLEKCYELMEELVVDPLWASVSFDGTSRATSPSSPVTVIELSKMDSNLQNIESCFHDVFIKAQSITGRRMHFGSQIVAKKRRIDE